MHISHAYDELFMQSAIILATKGWGRTGINPLVGAVVVKNREVVGQGFHRKIGEAHAEIVAMTEAGTRAANAELYVNLEPCCVQGITPPCVDAIIANRIKRVIVGAIDPNPAVNGQGIKILRNHGVAVDVGILNAQSCELNRWYRKYIVARVPYVILKIAASKNMQISGFSSRYITSESSLRYVHAIRSRVGAILVGINTVLKDDPFLTDRMIGRHNPARVVVDPNLEIPVGANFLKPNARRIIITKPKNARAKAATLEKMGAEFVYMNEEPYATRDLLLNIGMLKIGSVLVEGGGQTFQAFLNENTYDELYLFVAPATAEQGIQIKLDQIIKKDVQPARIGEDLLYHVYRNN